MKHIKYLIMYRKPDGYSLFEIQMSCPHEWGTKNYRGLEQESLTDDELRVYVKKLAESHNWSEVIKITEVVESRREISIENTFHVCRYCGHKQGPGYCEECYDGDPLDLPVEA